MIQRRCPGHGEIDQKRRFRYGALRTHDIRYVMPQRTGRIAGIDNKGAVLNNGGVIDAVMIGADKTTVECADNVRG